MRCSSHVALWWVLGLALFIVYTVIKFVIFKPTKLKPAKASESKVKTKSASPNRTKESCCTHSCSSTLSNEKKTK